MPTAISFGTVFWPQGIISLILPSLEGWFEALTSIKSLKAKKKSLNQSDFFYS
jgi:hypothetical protein